MNGLTIFLKADFIKTQTNPKIEVVGHKVSLNIAQIRECHYHNDLTKELKFLYIYCPYFEKLLILQIEIIIMRLLYLIR